jgi:hypothetical protein
MAALKADPSRIARVDKAEVTDEEGARFIYFVRLDAIELLHQRG